MKTCKSCQTLQDDSNKYCSQCGSAELCDSPATTVFNKKPFDGKTRDAKDLLKKAVLYLSAGVIALFVLAFWIIGQRATPTDRFMQSIKSDDFAEAGKIYQQEIVNKAGDYQEAYDLTTEYVNNLLEQYRVQSITYDALKKKLDGIAQTQILGYEIYDAYNTAETLQSYRATYHSAEEALNNGDYVTAISLFASISGADFEHGEAATEKYNHSVNMYRAKVTNEVQNLMDSHEFTSAFLLLEDALNVLPDDDELSLVRDSCIQAEYNYRIQLILEEVRSYINSNDYTAALSCLDENLSSYPEETLLYQEQASCLWEFEKYIATKSLQLAHSGEYQHALSLAESGLNYFESTKVKELATIYRSHLPVSLASMEVFATDYGMLGKNESRDEYLEDNYGNVYLSSLSVYQGSIIFLTNFKYQTLRGTVAYPKGVTRGGQQISATLTIYGDGNQIARFSDVSDTSSPTFFELSISSYERITLTWECKGANIWHNWGHFATIFDGMFVPLPLDLPEIA